MTSPASIPPVVNASSASARDLGELAVTVAEAVEEWAYHGASGIREADVACNMGSRLRVLGWLCCEALGDEELACDAGPAGALGSVEALRNELERATELLLGPPSSEPGSRTAPPSGFLEPDPTAVSPSVPPSRGSNRGYRDPR